MPSSGSQVNVEIVVAPGSAPSPPGGLPFTGFPVLPTLALALLLVTAGVLLHLVARTTARRSTMRFPPPAPAARARRPRGAVRTVLLVVVGVVGASLTATAAFAGTSAVPLTLTTATGTRTLSVDDVSGNPLGSSAPLALGSGHTDEFVTSVVDAGYAHVGYQVTATMSNLYGYVNGSYDFAGPDIPSSAVTLGFPTAALDLANVSNLVAPLYTLSGDLTAALAPIAALLPGGTNLTTFSTTVTAASQSVATLGTHVLDGTLAALPISAQHGTGGPFTTPASLGAGDPASGAGASAPTVLAGSAQPGDTSGVLAAVQAAVSGKTLDQLIASGALDQNAVLTAVAGTLGVPVTLISSLSASIDAALTPAVTALSGGLLGQSGSYNTVATLDGTPGNVPSGTYRGVLTLTLADVP